MESVQETPVKRRRIETGHVSSGRAYDSQEDSGDELFRNHETVATLPLPKHSNTPQVPGSISYPTQFITQPTQPIERVPPGVDSPGRKSSIVQVTASSPYRTSPSPATTNSKKSGGILASAMAPPGTAFRLPMGIARAPPQQPVINLSDDEGPTYQGSSSEEDSQTNNRANIKPSTFIERGQKVNTTKPNAQATFGMNKFQEITTNSMYKPMDGDKTKKLGSSFSGSIYDSRNREESNTTSRISAPAKRSADVMANAYGSSSRPKKQARQTGPAKAVPVNDVSLDDIPDFQQRRKIERMRAIVPKYSVEICNDALIQKRGHEEDALELLNSQEDQREEIDLTKSDDERPPPQIAMKPRVPAKQQLKAPNRTIQEKWNATQAIPRPTQPLVSSPLATPQKSKRRLIKGRKRDSSPATDSPREPTPPPRAKTPESIDESDSGIGSEPETDNAVDGRLLTFFNTCSTLDLADMAEITEKIADLVLSHKPFKNLDEVRKITNEAKAAKPTSKKQSTKKPIGDKIVSKCQEMWTGYEAVDELVRRCEALGKPLAEEMKKWGVDTFGASKSGELELVDFNDLKSEEKTDRSSMRDSGIGTPTSTSLSADEDGDGDVKGTLDPRGRSKQTFFPQPSIMAEGVILKDYQVVGVNWLYLLYEKRLSCILADDMGLGKTCQVISFLAQLLEKGIKGPHLVVVPGSTLENWLREFSVFCPKLVVMPYYAPLKDRLEVRENIEANLDTLNVIVTTYGMAKVKEDNKFLRRLKPNVCVYDEGHILKNSKSAGYDQLMRIPATFRMLLTGTPLQNNLRELASLLGFILPSVFKEHSEDLEFIFNHKAKTTDDTHAALLSAQRIARARSMMTPFVLRRKKHQVLKYLPKKTRRVEYCEMSASQLSIYTGKQAEVKRIIDERAAGKKTGSETANIMMDLRKASIHPLLFRRLYDDKVVSKMSKDCLKVEKYHDSDVDLVYEDMSVMTDFELHGLCDNEENSSVMSKYRLRNEEWMDSGKVSKLRELLTAFKSNGDRVLVFSQFVMVMNILESVMETLGISFFRLDGQTKIDERQDMIDQFYAEEDITVFLLSTKAGGAGINLACANKVVIFDSSFNPQDDIQAENRAHRVGQTREVEVIRLVTRGTIEEQIHALGETKLALDDRVAGEGGMTEEEGKKAQTMGAKKVEEMMIQQLKRENGDDMDEEKEKQKACTTQTQAKTKIKAKAKTRG